jgi:HTH-type transcriptional regulator, sugar sensing transcriptional regulator
MTIKIELLEEIGLTKSEIKVYLALLELGSTTTGKIVENSKASSSKIYEILDKLINKGLASYIIKSGTKYFEAADPKRILDYLQEKQTKLKKQTKEIKELIPELELKQKLSEERSETLVFKGIKGAETAFNDILTTLSKGEELIAIGFSEVHQQFQNFLINFHQKRAKLGIKTRLTFGESLREMGEKINALSYSQVKFHPAQKGNPVAILVYADKTLFSLAWDQLWIQIKNKRLADSFRTRFEELWGQNTITYKGFENVTNKFYGMLNHLKEGEEYYVLGGTYGAGGKKLQDWFKEYHQERIKRKIKVKILPISRDYKKVKEVFTNAGDPEMELSQAKPLPPEFSSPVQINLYKENKVLMFLFGKEPTCFEIESKELHDNFKNYFEALWNQETTVNKGMDAFKDLFETLLKETEPGEMYKVFGAGLGTDKTETQFIEFFSEFHQRRYKKGIGAELLFHQSAIPRINKIRGKYYDNKNAKIKFLPYDEDFPMQIIPHKDKTYITTQDEDPYVITINNKKVTDAFKRYIDNVWNQDVKIIRGLDAVQNLFEEMIEHKHCDLIGAKGYFLDEKPKYVDKWEKLAKKKGFTMRNIVDPTTKGHRITKFPFAETKYTIPKEFISLSVYWIFGNKVAISNWMGDEPIILVIENKNIYEMYKKQFESIWGQNTATYQGLEGIKIIREELMGTLKEGETLSVLGAPKIANIKWENWFLDFHKKRQEKGIKLKIIYNEDARKYGKIREKMKITEVKYLPNELSSPNWIDIFPDAVLFVMVMEKPIAFVVRDKELANSFRTYFQLMWGLGKK